MYTSLQTRIADLLDASSKQNEDISRMRTAINSLDRDKDSLQIAVDEKSEKINMLEEQLTKREQSLSELRMSSNSLEVTTFFRQRKV